MARSDLMKFWKMMAEVKITGRPSLLTDDEVWRMGQKAGMFEPELEAVLREFREFKNPKETPSGQGRPPG